MTIKPCTCDRKPLGPGESCDAHQLPPTTYAWCFDHGNLHRFPKYGTPWCTAAWVAFTAATETDALTAKRAAYGDAQFLNDLPADK
ncbi:hypothetical protein [Streptomyces griseus]